MKKYSSSFLVLSIILIVFACNNIKQSEQSRIAQEKQDSIRKDSLSYFVWKDAKFGMTKEDILQTEAFRAIKDYGGRDISFGSSDIYDLCSRLQLKELENVNLSFNDKGFYQIEFSSSNSVTADHIDDMESDCHRIVDEIEKVYGDVFSWRYIDLSVRDFDEGKSIRLLHKTFGNTVILVTMGKDYNNYTYWYRVTVTNLKIYC